MRHRKNGIVTLTGSVKLYMDKLDAEKRVRGIKTRGWGTAPYRGGDHPFQMMSFAEVVAEAQYDQHRLRSSCSTI